MSAKFHQIKIAGIREETKHARVISFDIPYELREEYHYTPGQYLTIEIMLNGEKVRRAYSICSKKGEPLSIGVKRVEGGLMSNYLNGEARVGDEVSLMTPMGHFTHDPQPFKQKRYVLMAGGSGITPMMSILKSTLPIEQHSQVILLYFNRNEEHIMFWQELDQVAAQNSNFKVVHNLDTPLGSWNGHQGRFSDTKARELFEQYILPDAMNTQYFMCGPAGLMDAIDAYLLQLGVNKERIHREFFTASTNAEETKSGATTTQEVSDTPLESANLVFKLDGEDYEVNYKGEDSILEAALDNDIDAPYACQIGACCTCRAKLTEGQVVMADRESLSDSELADGYILTCQSKPLTAKLVYSYDS